MGPRPSASPPPALSPPTRTWRWRWLALSGALLVSVCVVGPRAFAGDRGALAPPGLLSRVDFRDQRGADVRAERFAGSSILLNFVFTRCPSLCPTQTRELAKLRQAMSADLRARVSFVSVTLDPGYDTPENLLHFARQMGADWSFLAASPSATRELLQQLQGAASSSVLPEPEPTPGALPSGHGTALYLFDRYGRLMQRYVGAPIDQQRLLTDLARVDRVSPASASSLPGATPDREPSP
jgi:protein SCO1